MTSSVGKRRCHRYWPGRHGCQVGTGRKEVIENDGLIGFLAGGDMAGQRAMNGSRMPPS